MAVEVGTRHLSSTVHIPLSQKIWRMSGDDNKLVRSPQSLQELCSRVVGQTYPFELVQQHQPRVPEDLQKRIAFWSFPLNEKQVLDHASVMMGMTDYEFKSRASMVGHSTKEVSEMLQTGRRTRLHLQTCVSLV